MILPAENRKHVFEEGIGGGETHYDQLWAGMISTPIGKIQHTFFSYRRNTKQSIGKGLGFAVALKSFEDYIFLMNIRQFFI